MALYTKKLIMTTFQEMLAEMPFDKITVSALVKRAEGSPNTFYYHYQDIYALLFGSGRIFDVPLEMLEIAVFFSEADYHLQDYEYVLDILLAQTGIKAVDYKRLHIRFGHGIKIAERREDLVFYDERVG